MSALDWLLRTTWQAGALAVAIAILTRLAGNRLSPRWRYRIWWLVVLRLVLPPISLPGHRLPPPEPPAVTADVPAPAAPATVPAAEAAPRAAVAPARPAPLPAADPVEPNPPASAGTARGGSTSLAAVLLRIWLAGAGALALLALVREARLLRRIGADPPWADPAVLFLVDACRRASGVRRRVSVIRSRAVPLPALAGVFRPRLLLPEELVDRLPPAELRDVVLHEMQHLRRHDAAANWLLHAVACLHWPNPLAWLATARLRAEREVVRDLDALRRVPSREPRDYGRTILTVASAPAGASRPALVAILESRHDVKGRIAMIVRHAGRPARGAVLGVSLVLGLLAGTVLLASEPAAPPPPRPSLLVTGFDVSGDLLEKDRGLARSLEMLTEAILAPRFATVAAADVEAACARLGAAPESIPASPDVRLAVGRDLRVAACVTGWACSFGDRVVLIVEVIRPAQGLPGSVHRMACDGVEGIPAALEELLGTAIDSAPSPQEVEEALPEPAEAAVPLPALPDDDLLDTYPNDAYRRLRELVGAADERVSPEVAAEIARLTAEAEEHARRLREDPDYMAEYIVRGNVRKDPVLSSFEFGVVSRRPWILFVETRGDADPGATAERFAGPLSALEKDFRTRFVDGDRLPEGDPGLLRVIVFTRPESGRKYQEAIRQPLPPGVAWYSPLTRQLTIFAFDELETGNRLVHEGFHALEQAYARATLERDRGEEVVFTDPALDSRSHWIQEGLAELVAGAYPSAGGEWDYEGVSPRLDTIRQLQERRRPLWSLEELLDVTGNHDVMRHGPMMASAFYAQAWAFCHFLWNTDGGKYRARLLDAFRAELHGESGIRVFQTIWEEASGAPADESTWAALEEEWLRYVEGL